MLTVTSTFGDFAGRFGKVPGAIVAAEKRAVAKCAKVVEARVKKHFVGYTRTAGASLSSVGLVRSRTGHLRQSLNSSDAQMGPGGYFATVGFRKGTVDAYAKTVEEGGVFTPKTAKILAIPVGEALTRGGVARYQSPRDVEGGFWRQSVQGFLGFYRWVGKQLQLLFVGKRRVKVDPFKPLQRSLDGTRSQFGPIFEKEVAVAMRNALAGR